MRLTALFLLALTAILVLDTQAAEPVRLPPNQLTAAEQKEGWQLLFDGKTTTGWLEITGKRFPANCWTVENGSLKALVRTDGMQDIRTAGIFTNFDLRFDWHLLEAGNSGVKYLIQKVDEWTNKEGRQARARGLEYQLADDLDPDAASDPSRVAGALYSVIAPKPHIRPNIFPKDAEFNHSRIVVRGTHVEHWLNGLKVVEFETTDPAVHKVAPLITPGPISLQNHSSETWFQNIRILPLP